MTVFNPTKATGSHFYRYQSAKHLDRLRVIMLDHLLYVPTVAQLNDPTDCRPKVKPMSVEEMVTFLKNAYIASHPIIELDALQEHESNIRKNIHTLGLEWFQREMVRILNAHMEQFRVYSLSKRFNNLSLWAKYAAEHTGYCLEFVNEGPLFGEHAWEVTYGEYAPFDVNDSKNRDVGFVLSKRPEWSNEEEVRLLGTPGTKPLVQIEPKWLTRIILGKDMSPENQKQIREWAKQRDPELSAANVYFDELHQEIYLKPHGLDVPQSK
jgi:hypothetical protein